MGGVRLTLQSYRARLAKTHPHIRCVGAFYDSVTPTAHRCEAHKVTWTVRPTSFTRKTPIAGCTQCRTGFVDLTGRSFGQLTVLRLLTETNSRNERYWECHCTCGGYHRTVGRNLRSGDTRSCGCERYAAQTKHGNAGTLEYRIWQGILSRCYTPTTTGYENYGGRGILVCARWLDGEGPKSPFACFLEDMGPRPSPQHSVERQDVNGHYTPENCRWATKAEQERNKRNNYWVVYRGHRMILADAVRNAGSLVNPGTAWVRLKNGWTVAQAVETPPSRGPYA